MSHPVARVLAVARQLTARQWTYLLVVVSGVMVTCAALFGCCPELVSGWVTEFLNSVADNSVVEPVLPADDEAREPRVVDLSTLDYDHQLADLRTTFADGRPMDLAPFRSRGERICAQTLMTIFDQPFVSVRPDWLRNPTTGRRLELDCYNEELGLAVEYNGVQHYEAGHFDMTADDLSRQQSRDRVKSRICSEHGVLLIVVPYTVAPSKIPSWVAERIPPLFRARTVYFKGG